LALVPGLVIGEGTIYPLLSRLKHERLVDTRLEPSSEGPARKYYRLTSRGTSELARMRAVWTELVGAVAGLEREL
jgi:PadR family transcriptional regulator PadR